MTLPPRTLGRPAGGFPELTAEEGVRIMAESARDLAQVVGRMLAAYLACDDLNEVQPPDAPNVYPSDLEEWALHCSAFADTWEAMAAGAGVKARALGYRLQRVDSVMDGARYVRPNGEGDSEVFEDPAAAWRAADSDAILWEMDH